MPSYTVHIPTNALGQTVRSIKEDIDIEIATVLNNKRTRILSKIEKKVKELARRTLEYSDEFVSFAQNAPGDLKGEFGFDDAFASRVQAEIIPTILETFEIVAPPFVATIGSGIRGVWRINMSPKSYTSWLTNQSYASYISQPTARKNDPNLDENINWLEWLMYHGDTVIIHQYESTYSFDSPGHSRSGVAVMSRSIGFNRSWRVPPEFSGTQSNNWLTRLFRDDPRFGIQLEIEIEDAFNEVL